MSRPARASLILEFVVSSTLLRKGVIIQFIANIYVYYALLTLEVAQFSYILNLRYAILQIVRMAGSVIPIIENHRWIDYL